MNWLSEFWAKGRNRAFVYTFGFLVVLGSYVIGSPDRPAAEPVQKLKAKIATKSAIQNIEPIKPTETQDSETSTESKDQITPTTTSIPATTVGATAQAAPTTSNGFDPAQTYNPFSDPEVSEREKQAMRKELAQGAMEVPYEVSDAEINLYDKYEKGKITPEEKKSLIGAVMQFRTKPNRASKDKDGEETSKSKNETASTSSNSKSSKSSSYGWYANTKAALNQNKENESTNEVKDEEVVAGLKYGSVDNDETWFESRPRAPLPENLQYTHENLKIYQFVAGTNAGMIATTYNGIEKLYERVDANLEKAFHEQYRLPPDWSTRYRFDQDPGEEAKKARFFSNKMTYSLGTGGAVTFEVTKGAIVDKPGVDFMLWSNPFCYLNTPEGKEAVSKDAKANYKNYQPSSGTVASKLDDYVSCYYENAKVFVSSVGPKGPWDAIEPCQKGINPIGSACAGYGMNLWNVDPSLSNLTKGGDKYDLEKWGISAVKAIKIVDLGNQGYAAQAGYDLDAIAMINYQP